MNGKWDGLKKNPGTYYQGGFVPKPKAQHKDETWGWLSLNVATFVVIIVLLLK